MRKKKIEEVKSVVDYTWDINKPVVWDDVIDDKNAYQFTINTKEHFFDMLEERFRDGDKIVVCFDGEGHYPHVIVNQKELQKEDLNWIDKEYKTWKSKYGSKK